MNKQVITILLLEGHVWNSFGEPKDSLNSLIENIESGHVEYWCMGDKHPSMVYNFTETEVPLVINRVEEVFQSMLDKGMFDTLEERVNGSILTLSLSK